MSRFRLRNRYIEKKTKEKKTRTENETLQRGTLGVLGK